MSFNLRLPPALDIAARARAESVGISLNAFVCVALNAYLEAGASVAPSKLAKALKEPGTPKVPRKSTKKPLTRAEEVKRHNLAHEKKKAAKQRDLLDGQ